MQIQERMAEVIRSESDRPTPEEVGKYLPFNYRVTGWTSKAIWIRGNDNAGWTLDGYVIPRLASGNIVAREIEAPQGQPIVTCVKPDAIAPSLSTVETFGPFTSPEAAADWAIRLGELIPAEWVFVASRTEPLLPPEAAAEYLLNL